MSFIQTMRWFGPQDPVSLMDIRQAGCSGIVSALHQIPVGEVWTSEAVLERKQIIEEQNQTFSPLHWVVVESLPVHEDIKKGLPSREQYIRNYIESLRNLAANNIYTVCYNFMPVLDWSRTDLNYTMPDGSKALRFVWEDFALFDLFILKRPAAKSDYDEKTIENAEKRFRAMDKTELEKLTNTVLLGLPGSEEAFELSSFQQLLDNYKEIDDQKLRENLYYFLRAIGPAAEELGIKLCIHPDDPPKSLLGLPRVVSTEADLIQLTQAYDSVANGITFCTGSLGVRPDNDLAGIVSRLGDKIHFVHLRATKREEDPRNFHEADHLTGDVDMYEVIKALSLEGKKRVSAGRTDIDIPMRPDHGHQMLDDLQKKTYPGYSIIGRLKGLAELRGVEMAVLRSLQTILLIFCSFLPALADDGYRLWLKYDLIQDVKLRADYARSFTFISIPSDSPMMKVTVAELEKGLKGLLGNSPSITRQANVQKAGIILKIDINETPDEEAYHLFRKNGQTIISSRTEKGLLYGAFTLLRAIQTHQNLDKLDLSDSPKIQHRILNHWDNTNGSIERGYAGESLWKWYDLPDNTDPRYTDYARANASIGINGTVVNNVNASARFLTEEYLLKVKELANIFRPYNIKVFLSVRFSAPKNIGGLATSDPLDPEVRKWWKEKAKEIYGIIPDFGGFLVKANSEGEPGPQDYGRSHADGANMLAEAVEPFGGIVMWRAFVYKADPNGDRTKEAYEDFKPLDGQFNKNVIVQVKNGPVDFQPREPFHPLFGAMPQTPIMMEFQITQEYLGFATHWVYLAPMFKECLDTDTYAEGKGSTVAKVIDGSLHGYKITGIAGVANTGSDRNWCGHPMNQANWYAFGRLAWDYTLSSEKIADEWTRMTLTNQPGSVQTIKQIMLQSRENTVNYMTPLGLHHIMGHNLHFGPMPWLSKSARPDWTSIYYHKADSLGIGFNRSANGSNSIGLYAKEIRKQWGNAGTCPPEYLLWFHHVSWDYKLSSGKTLWDELCSRYYQGESAVENMQNQWNSVKKDIDPELFRFVAGKLKVQQKEALWWRDACVLYFQQFARKPIPAPYQKPQRSLEDVKKLAEIYQLR